MLIPSLGKSEKFCTSSLITCDAWLPKPSDAVIDNVPVDLIIEKLLSPILANVIFDGEPIALFNPSLMLFVFVFDDVKVVVVPSIVIE